MGKLYRSTPYASEIEPAYINHHYSGEEQEMNNADIRYMVRGTIYATEINTKLQFHKEFGDLSDARQYFDDVKKAFPISEIILQKRIQTDIKLYI